MVRLYGGKVAMRRVVEDYGPVVAICTEDEYENALAEGRRPDGLGFPRQDVIEIVKKSPSSDLGSLVSTRLAGD